MANLDGPVLVTGATGKQGGAVSRELLRRGHPVRALTRSPGGPAAQRLAAAGATLIHGDLDDPASIHEVLPGVRAVFSVQAITAGVEAEARQGLAVAEAAKATGVAHVVYSSVDGAERDSGVPHFESKWRIEQHLRALEVPTTVLRPTFLIDNFAAQGPQLVDGTLLVRLGLHPDTALQMVATADIGVFAADAFERPEDHIGTEVALAGDQLTGAQIAESFHDATGIPARFEEQPLAEIRGFSEDFALMLEWINKQGYDQADIGGLRQRHAGLRTLRDWLQETTWHPGDGAGEDQRAGH